MDTQTLDLISDILGGMMGEKALEVIGSRPSEEKCPECGAPMKAKRCSDYENCGFQWRGAGPLRESIVQRDWIDHLALLEGYTGDIQPQDGEPRSYAEGQPKQEEQDKPQISEELLGQIAERMKTPTADDWTACFSVALDKTNCNVPKSIQIADQATQQMPKEGESETPPAEPAPSPIPESVLLESGFSGIITDKAGHKRKYEQGKEVAMHHSEGAPPAPAKGLPKYQSAEREPEQDQDHLESIASNPKTLSALNKVTSLALSAAGGFAAVEHTISQAVKDKVNGMPAALRVPTLALYAGAMASYAAGNYLAKKVAQEKGMSPKQAEHFGKNLATWDLLIAKPAAYAAHATGVTAAVAFVPAASMGYVVMSLATNPVKTIKAAGKVVGGLLQKAFAPHGEAGGGWMESIEEELLENEFSGTLGWGLEAVEFVCNGETVALIESGLAGDGWRPYMSKRGAKKGQQVGWTKTGPTGKPVVVYGDRPGARAARKEKIQSTRQGIESYIQKPDAAALGQIVNTLDNMTVVELKVLHGRIASGKLGAGNKSHVVSKVGNALKAMANGGPSLNAQIDKLKTSSEPKEAPAESKPFKAAEVKEANPKLADESRPELTKDESDAIYDYSGGMFMDMNKALRATGAPPNTPKRKKQHAALEAAFAKTKPFAKPVMAIRGIDMYGSKLKEFVGQMEEAQKSGSVFTHSGYVSTTTAKKLPEDIGEDTNVLLKIKAKRGLDLRPCAGLKEEDELLLNHGSRFKVLGVKKGKDDNYTIEMEQVL